MNKDNLETIIEGYKVFNPDWTCRNFKYEVGKTYEHDGDIEVCEAGFHFCQKAINCFNYYSFDNKNKVAKIEAIGLIKTDGDKSVTNKITIVKEIKWEELLNIVNIGNCNSGDWNIGDYNSGVFCTDVRKIRMFNKETDLTYEDWMNSEARNILKKNSYLTKWIRIDDMTEEEEKNNPGYEINNGYLKVFTFEEMCKNMWDSLTEEEKKIIIEIPNFDADIFKEITGIEVI